MSERIGYLFKNSGLPGPRGNLSLMYSFIHDAARDEIEECLSCVRDDCKNSPEEFVAMCGVAGYCVLNKNNVEHTLKEIRKYASHTSWRIREAVAIGIQEIAADRMNEIIRCLESWADGNDLEKRAVVAALCEPKLLKSKSDIMRIIALLEKITADFGKTPDRISDGRVTLRKTLGYGWSVAVVSLPEEGKKAFEKIAQNDNKHIQWIVRENLKKNRLKVMDGKWLDKMLSRLK